MKLRIVLTVLGLSCVGSATWLMSAGCGARHSFTASGTTPAAPHPANCEFGVVSTPPDPSRFRELGTIGGCSGTANLNKYKDQIREDVCGAGGDVVLAMANGNGVWCQAVVFSGQ